MNLNSHLGLISKNVDSCLLIQMIHGFVFYRGAIFSGNCNASIQPFWRGLKS